MGYGLDWGSAISQGLGAWRQAYNDKLTVEKMRQDEQFRQDQFDFQKQQDEANRAYQSEVLDTQYGKKMGPDDLRMKPLSPDLLAPETQQIDYSQFPRRQPKKEFLFDEQNQRFLPTPGSSLGPQTGGYAAMSPQAPIDYSQQAYSPRSGFGAAQDAASTVDVNQSVDARLPAGTPSKPRAPEAPIKQYKAPFKTVRDAISPEEYQARLEANGGLQQNGVSYAPTNIVEQLAKRNEEIEKMKVLIARMGLDKDPGSSVVGTFNRKGSEKIDPATKAAMAELQTINKTITDIQSSKLDPKGIEAVMGSMGLGKLRDPQAALPALNARKQELMQQIGMGASNVVGKSQTQQMPKIQVVTGFGIKGKGYAPGLILEVGKDISPEDAQKALSLQKAKQVQ